jgi:hypothetical protein
LRDVARPIRDLSLYAMGLFRRKKAGWLPVEGRDDLVSVPEAEAEEMVNLLAMETYKSVDEGEIRAEAARALTMGFLLVTEREPATEETLVAAQSVARFGYMARVAEWETPTTARRPSGWMLAGLRGAVQSNVAEELQEAEDSEQSFYDVLGEVTAFFVRREPLDVPYDADQGFALMWTIPGMGGEVRALVRDKTLRMVLQRDGEGLRSPAGPIEDATLEDFQRIWKYGFLLRSFEEFFWEDS